MKKVLLKLAMVVMAIAALASCKKNDTSFDVSGSNNFNSEFGETDSESMLRGVPYDQLLANLEGVYGCCYDFDNYSTFTTPYGVSPSANLLILPSTWMDDLYLTLIISNSAQLVGVYQLEYLAFNKNDSDGGRTSYEFIVYYPEYDRLFDGFVYTNIPNNPDRIDIPNININLSDYPYSLFDCFSTGYTNLENCNFGLETNTMTPEKMAGKIASTFYIHFYLNN